MRRYIELTFGGLGILVLVTSCATTSLVAVNRTSADLKGMVYDLDRQPVADAVVSLAGSATKVTTDIHGRFAMANVALGDVELTVAKTGFESLDWKFRFQDATSIVYTQLASFDQLVALAANGVEKKDWAAFRGYADRAAAVQARTVTLAVLEATALEKQGERDQAIAVLEMLQTPTLAFVVEKYLGDLYASVGRQDKALEHRKKALLVREDTQLRILTASEAGP
jgi:hypothetical protein